MWISPGKCRLQYPLSGSLLPKLLKTSFPLLLLLSLKPKSPALTISHPSSLKSTLVPAASRSLATAYSFSLESYCHVLTSHWSSKPLAWFLTNQPWMDTWPLEIVILGKIELHKNEPQIGVYSNKCENWNIGNWKLSSKIGKLEFQRSKFGNQNFEKLFKDGILNKWMK